MAPERERAYERAARRLAVNVLRQAVADAVTPDAQGVRPERWLAAVREFEEDGPLYEWAEMAGVEWGRIVARVRSSVRRGIECGRFARWPKHEQHARRMVAPHKRGLRLAA